MLFPPPEKGWEPLDVITQLSKWGSKWKKKKITGAKSLTGLHSEGDEVTYHQLCYSSW